MPRGAQVLPGGNPLRLAHLALLACPGCRSGLALEQAGLGEGDAVLEGLLACAGCGARWPVRRGVPRFVPPDHYAANFGLEWTTHPRILYDSETSLRFNEERFFQETRWPRDLRGEVVLEVGCGAGKNTEAAAATGATVVAVDLSDAVDACYASHGHRENVLVVQGDAFALPLREAAFDKVFCIGVLQHTPDPGRAFRELLRFLRPGGRVAIDVYAKLPGLHRLLETKYWVRPLTRGMEPRRLYGLCQRYIGLVWPLARRLARFQVGHRTIGRTLAGSLLLVIDYGDGFPMEMRKELALFDLFDMLSPAYDLPQTLPAVRAWFRDAGLEEVEVHPGINGIEGRGRKPVAPAPEPAAVAAAVGPRAGAAVG